MKVFSFLPKVVFVILIFKTTSTLATVKSSEELSPSASVESIRRAIEHDPQNLFLRQELARLYEKNKDYSKAIEHYRKISLLFPNNLDARLHLAELYSWRGDFDTSIVLYKNILAVFSENLHAKLGLAEVFRWSHRYNEAIQLYDQTLKIDPGNHDAVKGLAKTYALAGDFTNSLILLEKGIKLFPADAEFYSEKGTVLAWQGHFKEGKESLLKALTLSPDSAGTYRTLGDVYLWMKDYSHAAESYHRALEIDPDSIETSLDLAKTYQTDGKIDLAEDAVKEALRHSPNNHDALERLQEIRKGKNDRQPDSAKIVVLMVETVIFIGPLGLFSWFFYSRRDQISKRSRYYKLYYRAILPGLFFLFVIAASISLISGYVLFLKFTEALIFWTLFFSIVYFFGGKRPTDFLLPETVLVVGAHPDDIELGTGGFLLRLKEEGKKIYGLVLSQGEKGTAGPPGIRRTEAETAATALGLDQIQILNFPDTHLREHIHGMKKAIEEKIKELGIGLVLTHSPRETHGDHLAVFEAAREASRQCSLLCFETVSTPQEFVPNFFVDISPYLTNKIRAIGAHKTQGGKFYMDPEMVRGRAAHRGLQAGIRYAEAFWIYRWIR